MSQDKSQQEPSRIYLPMTCELLTPGHTRIIRKCQKLGTLIVGLLTDKALTGYKKCVVPFKDRKEVLEFGGIKVVPQKSLNPYENLKKYKPDIMVSGDGFEPEERKSAELLNIELKEVKLKGEDKKLYSSSNLKKIICES